MMFRTQKAWGGLRGCVCALLLSAPVWGTGFIVKPLKMEITARAGETITQDLELHNFHDEKTRELDLYLVDIKQGDNGSVFIVDPNLDSDLTTFSCLPWITVNESLVSVGPLEKSKVTITVTIPNQVRGFYCAGLVVHARPDNPNANLALTVRFIVPVLVTIRGWGAQQRITSTDIRLSFREKNEARSATTLGEMAIANTGRSFGRIKGNIQVLHDFNGHWQHVCTTELHKTGIIPGAEFVLRESLERNLPSGTYKLKGMLYVDGRPVKPITKEFVYEGDATVTALAVDSSLLLEPSDVIIPFVPGSTRIAKLKLENASPETVHVEVKPKMTPSLKGVSLGDLNGHDLMCHEWIKAAPHKLILPGGSWRNVQLIVSAPRNNTKYANYYCTLHIDATYPDGQSAGGLRAVVCAENKQVKPKANGQVAAKVDLAWEKASQYVITAKFGNQSDVHFNPDCQVLLTEVMGKKLMSVALQGESQLMLPLETREFSGSLDFSKINEGPYIVKTVLKYGQGKPLIKDMPIKVFIKDGQRAVKVIGDDKESTG